MFWDVPVFVLTIHFEMGLEREGEKTEWKERGLGSGKETAKSTDVYLWEKDEGSAFYDCDVILVVECPFWRKIHIGETGHV